MNTFLSVTMTMLLAVFLTGCGEEEGPAEQMGQKVDDAVENMADQVESQGPAEKAGESIDQALNEAGESLQNAGEAVGDAMKEAGQQSKEGSGG